MLGLSFGSGMTLVHFEQQGARLFAAADSLDCRYIRACFKQRGSAASQYIQPNLSNMYDTAEDLMALGNEIIAFSVTPASYRLCKRLTSLLKELDEQNRIVWFGAMAARHWEKVLAETEADGCVRWEPEYTLHSLLEAGDEEWAAVPGLACRDSRGQREGQEEQSEEAALTAYPAGELDWLPSAWEEAAALRQPPILRVKWRDRQGERQGSTAAAGLRTHSPARLKQDVLLAAAAARQESPCLAIEGFELAADEQERAEVLAVLAEVKEARYRVAVPLEAWKRPFIEQLAEAGVTRAELRIPMAIGREASEDQEAVEAMKLWKNSDERVAFTVVLIEPDRSVEAAADPALTAVLLWKWAAEGLIEAGAIRAEAAPGADPLQRGFLPKPLAEFMLAQLKSEPEPALLNGYLAYMTGHYPEQILGSGVKHIGFTDGQWPEQYAGRLEEYAGLNSALLIEQNQVDQDDSEDLICFDQDQVWKRPNALFDRITEAALESDYCLSNAHQVLRQNEYGSVLQMNDFYHKDPVVIRQLDYKLAPELEAHGDHPEAQFQMLHVASAEDLEMFLDDVKVFSRTGKFRHGYEVESHMSDGCRWFGAHHCRARQLPRMFVDGGGRVSGCRGCEPIGHLGDSLDSLLVQAAVLTDEEQLRRGCASCDVRDTCSKCAFLPEYISREGYCQIRRMHPMLHRYMQTVQLFKGLRKYTQALRQVEVGELRVSLPTCTHLFPGAMEKGAALAVADSVFLFFVRETPMVYQASSQKILKLNEPMALILEAFLVGADKIELRRVLMERYKVEAEYADSSISVAVDLFVREGCLQLPARAS